MSEAPTSAGLRAALAFLETLDREGHVLDRTELRVQAAAHGIPQGALWQAVARVGGVPGWGSAAPAGDRAR